MALDVWLSPGSSVPCEGKPLVSFIDDELFSFLRPTFEAISQETGEPIDSYALGWFRREKLAPLYRGLVKLRDELRRQADPLNVTVMEKRELETIVDVLVNGVRTAIAQDWFILFVGD